MLIEQTFDFESRVPGPLVVHIPKTSYFHDKTKIFLGKSLSAIFMLKMLQRAMYLDSPDFGQVTKFNPKMQDFKRVWT